MFEIGQKVVCVKPAEAEWLPGVSRRFVPENVPVTGEIYTIRGIVTGSEEPGGPHWTKAPGIIGLLLVEIVNEPRWTTNGERDEQAFHENDFMPLDDQEAAVVREAKVPDLVGADDGRN